MKRYLTLLMSVVLLLAVLSGCAKKGSTQYSIDEPAIQNERDSVVPELIDKKGNISFLDPIPFGKPLYTLSENDFKEVATRDSDFEVSLELKCFDLEFPCGMIEADYVDSSEGGPLYVVVLGPENSNVIDQWEHELTSKYGEANIISYTGSHAHTDCFWETNKYTISICRKDPEWPELFIFSKDNGPNPNIHV